MSKTITINMKMHTSEEYVKIPVAYSIEHENENVINIQCRVDMLEENIPEWLNLRDFNIRQVSSKGNPGVTVTELSHIHCKSVDAALFLNSTHEQIRFAEKIND